MVVCAEMFVAKLRAKELTFNVSEMSDGDIRVMVPFSGKQFNAIFSGDDDGRRVAMRTVFEKCPEDRMADLLIVCNSLNVQYRWLKFCVDNDNDIMVEDDAILSPESAGEECFELLVRTASILDDVKPVIMRALYS